ncbi:MAG: hypothetical protein OEZ06_26470 [Myxococcales bacterium]|nr:hypothetical protein [Myxococcales bacterium]
MTPQDCPHVDTCEMYSLLKLAGTLRAWKARYCCADYQRCARYQLNAEGKPVPVNLMPSGAYLKPAGQQ